MVVLNDRDEDLNGEHYECKITDGSSVRSRFMKEMFDRGFIYQCSNVEALDNYLCAKGSEAVGYCGFDMTARSLHVGNLLMIMILKWFEICGHKSIILLGGATTKIGDPSYRKDARPILSDEEIYENMRSISSIFSRFFENPQIVNNLDWFEDVKYIDMLRNIGTCFSINKMVNIDIVRQKLSNNLNLSFLEFNYLVMQSYDFLHLYESVNCAVQFGGSDQWANIIHGADLVRRKIGGMAFGLTANLITNSNGDKMGKTANGAIWLNPEMKSPYDYWQFWRDCSDDDVFKFLRLYTFLPIEEIKKMESLTGSDINQAKIRLANEATKILHGEDAISGDMAFTATVFMQNRMSLVEILRKSEVVSSNTEAKNLIKSGAIKIDGAQVFDDSNLDKFSENFVINVGKNKRILVKIL
ncbi:tyrosine--tRNA ligase [Candidatus Gromoviella agglomerans]|uniref:tyrosine--tRNA ligase n=1 Tax=Candidatus Gromoviella agglomerans TaxID=2806609 RepID=UPI001E3BDA0B|nr:tyrosine--tRNA ligase [Candidatus Gromoviella agglomerans]UFX98584.1 Tyrosine--tRNA ligase [Candidatus Gromoviella agglomerans]